MDATEARAFLSTARQMAGTLATIDPQNASRMMLALQNLDESKIFELLDRTETAKADCKAANAKLVGLRATIQLETKASEEKLAAELRAHNEALNIMRKAKLEETKAINAEIANLRGQCAAVRAESHKEMTKMREDAAKLGAQLAKETKLLEDALLRLKARAQSA